jgi:hypothetical protein
MLQSRFRQVLGSNLAILVRDTAYYNGIFGCLPQSLYANRGVLHQIDHGRFPANLLVGNLVVLGIIQALPGGTEESGDKCHHRGWQGTLEADSLHFKFFPVDNL